MGIGSEKSFPIPNVFFSADVCEAVNAQVTLCRPSSVRSSHVGREPLVAATRRHASPRRNLRLGRRTGNRKRKKEKMSVPEKIRPPMFQSTNASPWTTSRRNPPSGGGDGAGDRSSPTNQPRQALSFLQPLLKSSIRLIFPTAPRWLPAGFPRVRQPSAAADPVCPARPPGQPSSGPASARWLPVTLRRTERPKCLKESVNTGAA